jgi:hypothetical protein
MLIQRCALLNVLAVTRKDKGSNFARSGACWIIETGNGFASGEFALCCWPRPHSPEEPAASWQGLPVPGSPSALIGELLGSTLRTRNTGTSVRHCLSDCEKLCCLQHTQNDYWGKFVWCQVVNTIQDGNVGPDLGDVGDGVETGAALPGDESGPDFT